jgi:hypothetical protein
MNSDELTAAPPMTRELPAGAMPRFRATRSEAKRLNRWSFAGVGAGLLAFFAAMATVIRFLGDDSVPDLSGVSIDLASAQGLVAGMSTASSLIGVVVLACWAAATASDYSTGWIRVMVQAEPRPGVCWAASSRR